MQAATKEYKKLIYGLEIKAKNWKKDAIYVSRFPLPRDFGNLDLLTTLCNNYNDNHKSFILRYTA